MDHIAYDSFGKIASQSSTSVPFYFMHNGVYVDSATGLEYHNEPSTGIPGRWYSPAMERWMSQDPTGLMFDSDPYRYSDNSPTNLTDPSGLADQEHERNEAAEQQEWDTYEKALAAKIVRESDPRPAIFGSVMGPQRAHTYAERKWAYGKLGWGEPPEGPPDPPGTTRPVIEIVPFFTLGVSPLGGPIPEGVGEGFGSEAGSGSGCSPQNNVPRVIYREGGTSPSNLTPRPKDQGNLSFRDSLSNPVTPGTPGLMNGRPVLRPGEPYTAYDTSKLPPGTVKPDGVPGSTTTPPGHVSVSGVTPQALKDVAIPKPPTPPYGPGASGKFPE